jgi:PiT family inorganic phosphate transporter
VKFAQPLLFSPVIAIGVTALVYPLVSRAFAKLKIRRESCLCMGSEASPETIDPSGVIALTSTSTAPRVRFTHGANCAEQDAGRIIGIRAQPLIDAMHYLSGGAVCFARAVNDTPKIAALMLAAGAIGYLPSNTATLAMVALAMAAGGWIHSRRVAETMSRGITELSPGQGLTANLMTATVVLGASRLGLPVSTTHVSCGSIFGIGIVQRNGRWRTILQILTAWLTTLPFSAALGAGIYWLIA